MKNSTQMKTNGSAAVDKATSTNAPADTIPFDQEEFKSNLDRALEKVENGQQQEAEGRYHWVEGTLETINILHAGRQHHPSDQAFGKWLDKNGYKNRIKRNDRQALQNMGKHPDLTREVLQQTHRRSWRLIWEEEIQPRLHSPVQPTDGEKPKVDIRRPEKRKRSKPKAKPEWSDDSRGWCTSLVERTNALTHELTTAMENCTTPEKHDDLRENTEPDLLLDAIQKLRAKVIQYKGFVNKSWDEATDELIREGRVIITPAPNRATEQSQPEA
jgi:hypothetical protein